MIAATMDTCYNLAFLMYINFALRNALKKSYVPKYAMHIFAGITVLVVSIMAHPGRNKYGTCSVDLTTKNLLQGGFVLVVTILYAFYVYIRTERSLPSLGLEMSEVRRDFLKYYRSYIKGYMTICSIVFLSYVIQVGATNQNGKDVPKDFRGVLFNFGKFGNTAKSVMPLLLFFIRIQDPLIQRAMMKPFRRMTSKFNNILGCVARPSIAVDKLKNQISVCSETEINYPSSPINQSIAEEETFSSTQRDILEEELQIEEEDDDLLWMNLLPGKMKEAFTRTFVAAINAYYPSLIVDLIKGGSPVSKDDSEISLNVEIDGKELMRRFNCFESMCNCKMNIFGPKLFRDILINNNKVVNFEESLAIHSNFERIKKAGESGGASGEMMMFTHDNQLLIKTITAQDYRVFTQMLVDYSSYLKYNKSSMIGKIYGMFEFRFEGSCKPIRIVIMENLFTIPNEAILRKYDLKGSHYQRKVLKTYEGFDRYSACKGILKDLDFIEIEKTILFMDPIHRMNVIAALKRDTDFFASMNIMDYSLIVAVASRRMVERAYLDRELAAGAFHLVASRDPEVFYIIGLIDYFQRYTWGKSFERLFKKAKTCDPNLQTSSQPASRYANRFMAFIQNRLI